MKKLFFIFFVSVLALSLAGFASAQQRGYQGGQSGQYETQQQSQYGQDQWDQQRQYGSQDQYGRDYGRDQWGRQQEQRQPKTGFMGRRHQLMAGNFQRASDLMDKKVKSQTGEDLGDVDDLIITRNGLVAYLILSHGGALGVGSKYIPIPFRNAQFSEQENALILPNIDKAALDNAPTISKNEWQRLEDPGFERQVFSYYGRPGQGMSQQWSTQQQQPYGYQQEQPGRYQQEQRPMQQQQRSGQMGR